MATTNPPIYISEAPVMLIVAAVVILFSSAIIWAMVRDYRLYLQNFDQAKYSFAHFIKREQYYVCLLLFFFFLVGIELCMQAMLAGG